MLCANCHISVHAQPRQALPVEDPATTPAPESTTFGTTGRAVGYRLQVQRISASFRGTGRAHVDDGTEHDTDSGTNFDPTRLWPALARNDMAVGLDFVGLRIPRDKPRFAGRGDASAGAMHAHTDGATNRRSSLPALAQCLGRTGRVQVPLGRTVVAAVIGGAHANLVRIFTRIATCDTVREAMAPGREQ